LSRKDGEPLDARLPWLRRLSRLDAARQTAHAGERVAALKKEGRAFGDALREGERVVCVRTLDVSSLLYPTRHAFNSAVPLPLPFVEMRHRCLLVQVKTSDGVKNVLWNPTDAEASKQTPFFRKLIDTVGERTVALLQKKHPPVDAQLRDMGVRPEDIDLVAFDHFHTQDLRAVLPRFPNALLLAPRAEWRDWGSHPMQRAWFVDGGNDVDESRVVFTEEDVLVGEGCAVLRSPGHTLGNQTIFVHAADGVFGCSENGTSCDNWAPHASRIPGLARYAKLYEVEVVLNANTPELGGDQYCSMILEKSIVDPAPGDSRFPQMFPSSEVTPTALAPGIHPTMIYGSRESGTLSNVS
jgi:glyoxylase-like metal-dependent hydrolase (beta-lactamase superfamily II)